MELPSGAVAYLKPELTAGEYDEVQSVFFESVNFDVGMDGKLKRDFKFNPGVMIKARYKLLAVAITKIERDGKVNDKITEDYIKGMGMKDVELMAKEADKMYQTSSLDAEAKKK